MKEILQRGERLQFICTSCAPALTWESCFKGSSLQGSDVTSFRKLVKRESEKVSHLPSVFSSSSLPLLPVTSFIHVLRVTIQILYIQRREVSQTGGWINCAGKGDKPETTMLSREKEKCTSEQVLFIPCLPCPSPSPNPHIIDMRFRKPEGTIVLWGSVLLSRFCLSLCLPFLLFSSWTNPHNFPPQFMNALGC